MTLFFKLSSSPLLLGVLETATQLRHQPDTCETQIDIEEQTMIYPETARDTLPKTDSV